MIPIDRWEIVESLTVFPREHRKAFALEMVRRLIQELYLHEIDEQIVYEGKLVFDPHADPSLPRPLKETAVV